VTRDARFAPPSVFVLISRPMYKCKVFPYPITSRRPEKVMPAHTNSFGGGRPNVRDRIPMCW
jgi:hypothetical protein